METQAAHYASTLDPTFEDDQREPPPNARAVRHPMDNLL